MKVTVTSMIRTRTPCVTTAAQMKSARKVGGLDSVSEILKGREVGRMYLHNDTLDPKQNP